MSPFDLQEIESALDIKLPAAYKQRMTPFPVRYLAGNADEDLWDDATAIIERNRELRADTSRPWPRHWLFIGDPLSGCANAIYLLDPAAPIAWVDHCDLSEVEAEFGEPFEPWSSNWIAKARADLIRDDIDPDGEPPSEPKPWPPWVGTVLFCGIVLWLVLFGAAGVFILVRDILRWFISK